MSTREYGVDRAGWRGGGVYGRHGGIPGRFGDVESHHPQPPLFVSVPGQHCGGSGGVEAPGDGLEQPLVRPGAAEQEADAARVA